MHQCKLAVNWLESSFVEKELRFLVGKKWNIIQQRALEVKKANSLLRWIRQCCQQQVKGRYHSPLFSPGETHLEWFRTGLRITGDSSVECHND